MDADLVLWDLQRVCHAFDTTFVQGDTHGSAQLEGRRQVFLRILQYLRMDPTAIMEMVSRGGEKEAEFE